MSRELHDLLDIIAKGILAAATTLHMIRGWKTYYFYVSKEKRKLELNGGMDS
jgi:hypothetical protein